MDASISGSRDGTITDRTEREEFTHQPEELQSLTQDGAGAEVSLQPPQSRQPCPVLINGQKEKIKE
ncbi:unnamed protein product [Arabis nemorensis]|uniref:Uncharacterized protein n=1 Tax=Arabis nemorensis TaxID=586526 RepID=A0A565CM02_9BRAS|nr:unnamed protein product [Arabis nemorensis]